MTGHDEQELPRPIENDLPAWELDLARALGYTLEPDGDHVPTCYNLPEHPFAFLEDTDEVIVWEVDGPLDDRFMRHARVDPVRRNEIALTARRAPMPPGFRMQTITTPEGQTHRIALRDAA